MGGDPGTRVAVVGGGVAGLSAACALAEAGMRVRLLERRSYLGGRASSFRHPGVGEVIDNCQHVLFGCCTNLIGFYRRAGVLERIRWSEGMTLIEPGGRRTVLGPSALPAPFHGLPRLLGARAFGAADKLALARAFAALARPVPPDSPERLAAWLARHGQTPRVVERFWRLVIASALNADLESVSLAYGAKVVRELFLNSAEAGRMGVSTVPLGELYAGAAEFLRGRGGELVFNARVEGAAWDAAAGRWSLPDGTSAEHLVLALPFEAVARLLPGLPAAPGAAGLGGELARHEHWPLCSVHLWFDREITELEHAALLDRRIHWLYHKSRFQPGRGGGSYVELVVSADRGFAALAQEEAVAQALAELGEFFPAAREARLLKSAFVKEVRATFGVPPGIDAARPGPASPWPNCWLAGDWTGTGWPSTMESAARSGHRAAEAVCSRLGAPRAFLEPDLRPRGLMALLPSAARARTRA
ncbi:MAG TPA: hydroxysqualene dehydroxylase HpnE [Opitutaceae bacterium]|nr:hydroxysqualene dehydroxylase HpnE [Opitutaceae bacterium]